MESTQQTESKKRTIKDFTAQQLAGKCRSKQDFVVFLDQQ